MLQIHLINFMNALQEVNIQQIFNKHTQMKLIFPGAIPGSPEAAGKCKAKKEELDQCLAVVAPIMPKVGLPHTRPQLDNMCKWVARDRLQGAGRAVASWGFVGHVFPIL